MARRGLSLDLNVIPDCQDQTVEGDSVCANSEQPQGICSSDLSCRVVIDVDDFDDDVLPSSRRTFHEARKRSRTRNRLIAASGDDVEICKGCPMNVRANKRKRSSLCQQQSYDNQTDFIDLEAAPRIQGNNVLEPAQLPQQVPAKVAPTFSCPICMEKLKIETSTKCGHIFCEDCIKKALSVKKCCPTCRKKLRAKDIFRIYLPNADRV
ncbi:unnamed protein product [Rhodiola kirilowii]